MEDENAYIQNITNILNYGDTKQSRNGIVKSMFGIVMRFNLNKGLPLLTTKKLSFRIIVEELLWFIRGNTDNNVLNKKNIHIWDGNSSEEFMNSRNLSYRPGLLGPIYGFQWRHYGAEYNTETGEPLSQGYDQLQYIIESLKHPTERYSRRLVLNSWNVKDINMMALPPCHVMSIFNVTSDNKLNCMLTQRSGDMGLGVPFNIASYSIFVFLLAHHCGLKVGTFVHTIADAHIYEQHFDSLRIQIQREILPIPHLNILTIRDNINDYVYEDFELINYTSHSNIKMEMIV